MDLASCTTLELGPLAALGGGRRVPHGVGYCAGPVPALIHI